MNDRAGPKQEELNLRLLLDFSIALSSETELDVMLNHLLEMIFKIEGPDCGGIYLVDENTGCLDMPVHRGLPDEFIAAASHFDADAPQTQLVMEGKSVHTHYSELLPLYKGSAREREQLKAISIIPIQYHGRTIAVMNIASHKCDKFDENTLGMLTAIVAQVGVVLTRIKAEEKLRESEERFRMAFETSPDLLAITKMDGTIIHVNKGFSATGYSIEEIIGRNTLELNLWADPADRKIMVDTVKQDGSIKNLETSLLLKDGTIRRMTFSANLITLYGEPHVLSVARDIEDAKRAEEALRESEERFRTLVEIMPYGVAEVDTDGKITFSNAAHDRIHGREKQGMTGMAIWNLQSDQLKTEQHREYFEYLLKEQPVPEPYIAKNRTADGRIIDVHVEWTYSRNLKDEVTGFVSVITDITDRKLAEEEIKRKNKELLEALRVKTEFLSMVSHELRSPLVPILGYSELLLDGSLGELPSEALAPVAAIKERAEDLTALIDDLLILSRMERDKLELKLVPIDIHQHIRETIVDFESTDYGKPIGIECTGDEIQVIADHTRFHQVLRNLIDNAVKYSKDGVEIRISTSAVDNMGLICVSDNGIGISPEHLTRIFERFYQIEEIDTRAHTGTGLGLSVTKELLELMNGSITVESEPGKGSKFCVALPLA